MRKTVANKGQRPKTLTGRTVKRIARAVNAFERGDRDMPGRRFSKSVGDWSDRLRVGKVATAWNINTTATVTIWEGGTPPDEEESSPAETVEDVVNKLAYVPADRFVLIMASENGSWYLVAGDIPTTRLGKTTADWDKGTTATITLWDDGEPDAEAAGGTLAGCVNKYTDVLADKWVHVSRAANGKWYLIAAEC
jgi:hypothetical protein